MSALGDELYAALVAEVYRHPANERACLAWHMSPEWFEEICALAVGHERVIWFSTLLGYPYKVSEEYGVPELVFELA